MTRPTTTSPAAPRHWLQMISDFGSALDFDVHAFQQESVTQVRDRLTELEARLARLEGAAEQPLITAIDDPKENKHG